MSFLCPYCYTYYPQADDQYCPKCQRAVPVADAPSGAIADENTLARLPPPARDERPPVRDDEPGPDLDVRKAALLDRIRLLERRVEELERGGHTNLTSRNFLARAFAVLGHFIVAYLLIAVPLFLIGACSGWFRRP